MTFHRPPSGSLARRFATAAAALAIAATLLIALLSWSLISDQHAAALKVQQQREVEFHAKMVSRSLYSVVSRISEIAGSSILATGLVDSAGRETYLAPYLNSIRQIGGVPVEMVFTDFAGQEIVSTGHANFTAEEIGWLKERLAEGRTGASIFTGPKGDELVAVEFLLYSRTQGPEGALLYKLAVADLQPGSSVSIEWGRTPQRSGEETAMTVPIDVPPVFQSLRLRVVDRGAQAASASVSPNYISIIVVVLGIGVVVFILGSRLALNLTSDLRQLDAFAGRVVEKGFGSERTEIRGSTEIAGLARSINHMLDRLHEQHARLRDESEKLHQLANTILPLAWMANPDGWIHWYNDRWYAYTGTTPEQMKGWGWQSAHHPDYLPKVMEKWQESIATGETFQMTFPLRGADGNYRTFFTLAAPLKDAEGRIVHWFGTNTDISTLEEAERAVRESEERLNEGLVAARMAVWDWALDSGAIRMSANTHELLGREFTTARQFWETLHPDDYPRIRSAVEEARKGDHRFKEIVRVRRADSDEYIWVEIRGKFVFDESGAPYSLRGVAIDITERKRAEEALQAANKRKDEFLAMLAHELRNPLAPISMSAEILKWSNGDEKRVKNVSEVIGRQVAHMSSLLDDLLDVSRVTRGLITLNREPALLGQIVENAAEQAAPLIKTRRHELTIVNDAADAVIYADQIRMVQVVTNLLNNAAKYTEEGGAILLETRREGNQAVIAVRDNGIGIAPDLLPHVFELFTQAERSPDRSQGGLGLGLALVKSLVELHGGSVSAFSKGPGQGSEFRVVLPLAVSTRAVSQPANAIASRVGERCLRIMIVDDNQDAADSLATLLDAEKHVITTCYHPNDALNAAAEEEFDAFIIDIGLPYIDGYELGSRLRRETANANALFIALTGYGDQHAVQQSAAAGFSHHFVKPVKFTTLLAALGGLNAAVDGEEKE